MDLGTREERYQKHMKHIKVLNIVIKQTMKKTHTGTWQQCAHPQFNLGF
jgi:phage tail tube protein FII